MDSAGVGLVAGIFMVVGGIVVVGGGAIGIAYAVDAPLEATVIEGCSVTDPSIRIETKLFSITSDVEVEPQQCAAIHKGNFVKYHIKSERTIIFESEGGACIYDTDPAAVCS